MDNVNIIRVQKDKDNPYVVVNKIFLNENRLSLKAKGLLAYLLSLPDNWKIYIKELEKHHKDGRESISTAINELIKYKYMHRIRVREKGQFKGYCYKVYEKPVNIYNVTENGFSVNGKTENGKPVTTK